jgi:hypothetical protein
MSEPGVPLRGTSLACEVFHKVRRKKSQRSRREVGRLRDDSDHTQLLADRKRAPARSRRRPIKSDNYGCGARGVLASGISEGRRGRRSGTCKRRSLVASVESGSVGLVGLVRPGSPIRGAATFGLMSMVPDDVGAARASAASASDELDRGVVGFTLVVALLRRGSGRLG